MIRVTNIRVRSLTPHNLQVAWEVENTSEDLLDYDFRIQRSESAEGPFTYVTDAFCDKYQFVDSIVDVETRSNRVWYYRVEATRRSTGYSEVFGPSSREPAPDNIALELQRQANQMYQLISGRRCWLFPLRTFGQRCRCFDPEFGSTTKSQCRDCYGTGFARGYLDPIEVYVQFDPTPTSVTTGLARTETMKGQTAHLGSYPDVLPGALLVEPENIRWIVRSATGPERYRARTRQDLVLDEVPLGAIEYQVPLNLDDLMSQEFGNPFMFAPITSLGEDIPWS